MSHSIFAKHYPLLYLVTALTVACSACSSQPTLPIKTSPEYSPLVSPAPTPTQIPTQPASPAPIPTRSMQIIVPENAHDLGEMAELSQGAVASGIRSLAFSPDGKTLVAGNNSNTAWLWDVQTGQLLHTFEAGTWAESIAFSHDGQLIAVGAGSIIYLWNARNFTLVRRISAHLGANRGLHSLALSPDDRLIVSGANDGAIRVWKVDTGEAIYQLKSENDVIFSVTFSPDGQTFATAGGRLRIWDTKSGRLLKTLTGFGELLLSVAYSPDGKTLATAGRDYVVLLWDVTTGQIRHRLEGHSWWTHSVTFSPDGRIVASASEDGSVRVWNVINGQLLETMRMVYPYSVTFSRDGKMLAAAGDGFGVILFGVRR